MIVKCLFLMEKKEHSSIWVQNMTSTWCWLLITLGKITYMIVVMSLLQFENGNTHIWLWVQKLLGTWAYWINYSWHFSLKKAVYHSVTWTLLALLKPLFSSVCVCVYLWPIVIITNFNLNHKRISSKSCYRLSYSDWHLFGSVDYCCSSVNNFDKSPFKKKNKNL